MTRRRRRDGEGEDGVGPGAGGPSEPRVQGAWETPAVVVRAPDGSIVTPAGKPAPPAQPGKPGPPARRRGVGGGERAPAGGVGGGERETGKQEPPAGDGDDEDGRPAGPRLRPRRIPGAPGSVLVIPTLRPDAADGRLERRRRRLEAPSASVTPLPPRPQPRDEEHEASPAALRPVGSVRGHVSGRGARRPTPARPGEPRRQRVLEAVAALNVNLDRLLPADDEARQRRLARLRRVGMRVASLTLAAMLIYAVFPVRTWLNQRAATERAREQIEVLSRENDRLEQRADDLRDPETVEEIARSELGWVMPGEESYGILPAPEEPATTTTVPGQ